MSKALGFCMFMIIWIAGCALADYILLFETRAWTMFWGFVVGTIAMQVQVGINKKASEEA